ncbi:hypothetical protein B566_EDAN017539 [Ephemera danica]|nr:hypothetical protein B566_EDAN017539 [Ephemera danica]
MQALLALLVSIQNIIVSLKLTRHKQLKAVVIGVKLFAECGQQSCRHALLYVYLFTHTLASPSFPLLLGVTEEDCLEEYHAVELSRGKRGFGFSIRGGQEFQNMPLFVLQIAENGPASVDNRLRVSDQIIEINGVNTKNMTHAEAIEIIRNGGPCVRLLVKRGGKIPASIAADSGGATMRPSSSLSQPSSALTTTASTLNGVMCWERFPPS